MTKASSKQDSRKNSRRRKKLVLRAKWSDLDEFVEQFTVNVSKGGIFIQSKKIQPVGSNLEFEIQLKDGKSVLRGNGDVVWGRSESVAAGKPTGMGVRFTAMDKASKAVWKRIIDEKEKQKKAGKKKTTRKSPAVAKIPLKDAGILREVDMLSGITDQKELIQKTCEILTSRMDYFNAWIVLLDESQKLVSFAESQVPSQFIEMEVRLRNGVIPFCAEQALIQGDVVSLTDPPSACSSCPLAGDYSGRGEFCVPLIHGDAVLGLLIASTTQQLASDEDEISIIRAVGRSVTQALVALDNDNRLDGVAGYVQAQEDLQEELEKLGEKYKSLKGENKELQSDLDEINLDLVKVLREKSKETKTTEDITNTRNDLAESLERAEEEKAAQIDSNEELKSVLEHLKLEMESQANENEELLAAVQKTQTERESQANENEELKSDLERLKAEQESQRSEDEGQKSDLEQLKAELESQRSENEELLAALDKTQTERESQRSEFEELKSDLEQLKAEQESYQSENVELLAALDKTQTEREAQQGEYEELKSEMEQLKAEQESHQSENVELLAALDKTQTEREAQQGEYEELKSEMEQLKADQESQQTENKELLAAAEKAKTEQESQRSENEELKSELERLSQDLDRLIEEKAEEGKSSEDILEINAGLRKQLEQMEEDLDRLLEEKAEEAKSGEDILELNAGLRKQLEQMEEDLDRLLEEKSEEAKSGEDILEINEGLKKQLEQMEAQWESRLSDHEGLNVELEKIRSEHESELCLREELKAELDRAKEEYTSILIANEILAKDNADLREESRQFDIRNAQKPAPYETINLDDETKDKPLEGILGSSFDKGGIEDPKNYREKLIQSTVGILVDKQGCTNAWAVLIDESGSVITHAEQNMPRSFRKMAIRLRNNVFPACVKKALERKESISIEDPATVCAGCSLSRDMSEQCAYCMPLANGDKVFGAVVGYTEKQKELDAGTIEEIEMLGKKVAHVLSDIDKGTNDDSAQEMKPSEEPVESESDGDSGEEVQPIEEPVEIESDGDEEMKKPSEEPMQSAYDSVVKPEEPVGSDDDSVAKSEDPVEGNDDALISHDFMGVIIDANENACRLTAYESEQLIGSLINDIDMDADDGKRTAHLIEVGELEYTTEFRRRDNTLVQVSVDSKVVSTERHGTIQVVIKEV
jgi:uncharacterized protein (TIGR02266 family)